MDAIVLAFGMGWERRQTGIVGGLAVMGIGPGTSGASVQTAALEAVPAARAGSAAGTFSPSRYLGSVVRSTALATMLARQTGATDRDRFVTWFTGLAVVAFKARAANALVPDRRVPGTC